jgi:hypothetical protein
MCSQVRPSMNAGLGPCAAKHPLLASRRSLSSALDLPVPDIPGYEDPHHPKARQTGWPLPVGLLRHEG